MACCHPHDPQLCGPRMIWPPELWGMWLRRNLLRRQAAVDNFCGGEEAEQPDGGGGCQGEERHGDHHPSIVAEGMQEKKKKLRHQLGIRILTALFFHYTDTRYTQIWFSDSDDIGDIIENIFGSMRKRKFNVEMQGTAKGIKWTHQVWTRMLPYIDEQHFSECESSRPGCIIDRHSGTQASRQAGKG